MLRKKEDMKEWQVEALQSEPIAVEHKVEAVAEELPVEQPEEKKPPVKRTPKKKTSKTN